jgi:hypothetical protein
MFSRQYRILRRLPAVLLTKFHNVSRRGQQSGAGMIPVAEHAPATPVLVDEKPETSDWMFFVAVLAALSSVIGPIALVNELETSSTLRQLFDLHLPLALPLLREYFDIPRDDSVESVACDMPRGDQLIKMWTVRASGSFEEISVRADTHLSDAISADVKDLNDPVVDLLSDAPAPHWRSGHSVPISSLNTTTSDFVACWLFPWRELPLLGFSSALGAFESKQSLTVRTRRLELALSDTALALQQSIPPDRPLARAVLLEKQQRLSLDLERSRRYLAQVTNTSALGAAATTNIGALAFGSAAPFWLYGLFNAPFSQSQRFFEAPSRVIASTSTEEARIDDRLRRIRMILH